MVELVDAAFRSPSVVLLDTNTEVSLAPSWQRLEPTSPGPLASAPTATRAATGSPNGTASATTTPSPPRGSAATALFIRPFDFAIPRASTIELTVESPRLYAFTQPSGEIIHLPESSYAAYPRDPDGKLLPGVRGVTVASTDGAVTHPCPGTNGGPSRVPVVGARPRAFLDDLRRIAGIGLGEPSPTTIDDRPALAVTVDPGASLCDWGDFHVASSAIGSGYVVMNVPSRLWLVEVDGVTVVIQGRDRRRSRRLSADRERIRGLGPLRAAPLNAISERSMLAIVPAEQIVVVMFVNDPGFIFEFYVRDLMSASKAG